MHLKIGNKVITTDMKTILNQLRSELTNGKLRDIGAMRGNNIPVTCPHHKDGMERHPSCMVFADPNDKETEYGFVHCFTCGYARPLPQFIADCFDEPDIEFGQEWLLERCQTAFLSEVDYLPPIELNKKRAVKQYMDESILKCYEYYHDYMWYRKLTKEIVDLFEVGYDPVKDMITFPVRDEQGGLVFITGRYVKSKRFQIPEAVQKPVYLLYYILQQKITSVAVCESQINCLYLWSIGIPAVCLFGTGTTYQYQLLRKSGIRSYILMFDGDSAGRKGAIRFRTNMQDDAFITDVLLPAGKDVNDLTPEEVKTLTCY